MEAVVLFGEQLFQRQRHIPSWSSPPSNMARRGNRDRMRIEPVSVGVIQSASLSPREPPGRRFGLRQQVRDGLANIGILLTGYDLGDRFKGFGLGEKRRYQMGNQ